MYKQNLHVHSTYCDGVDSPEQMLLAAIEQGFDSVGFSGHSYMWYSPSHSMSLEGTEQYKREVRELAQKYADRIKVFCGLEVDMYSEIDLSGYDYLIGSVHYLPVNGQLVGFDRDQNTVAQVISDHFGGDGMAYAKLFYQELARLPEYGKFDIIGHYDLITKHSEKADFFVQESPLYQKWAVEAAEALVGKIPYFEVNTGAISRGYRTSPYPSVYLLKELKRLGFGACISSDCHNSKHLSCAYDDARELLQHCGFNEIYVLTERGFEPSAL